MRPYSYIILVILSLVPPSYGIQGSKIKLATQESRSGLEEEPPLLTDSSELLNLLEQPTSASYTPIFLLEEPEELEISTNPAGYDSDSEEELPGQDQDQTMSEGNKSLEKKAYLVGKKMQPAEVYNYSRKQRRKNDNRYEPTKDISNYHNLRDPLSPIDLAKDTKLIERAAISQGHLTIFCVALRDKYGNIKKFAFSNSTLMPQRCREQAESLGYAVIKARQSHAEGQFLQFLYQRKVQHLHLYTHLVGMGCSRLHCPECDALFNRCFGENYKELTAAIDPAKTEVVQVNFAPASSSATDHNPFRFGIATKIIHEIVLGPAAVRPSQSENYYLPPILQKLIGHLTNHSTVNIASNSRYGPSSHKRRLQAGSSID